MVKAVCNISHMENRDMLMFHFEDELREYLPFPYAPS